MFREEYPVYLFTGFLESGKTSFINETLSDPKFFKDGDRTLLLLCEEGEIEPDPSVFASPEVYVEIIDDKSRLNPDKLEALRRKHKANRILLEYNGMWLVSDLFASVPRSWVIYQIMNFADANTIEVYNANMRNLVVDKLSFCELTVFNRCTPETDVMALHSAVRAVSRRVGIIYEYVDGKIEQDEIEDPLPFDINAPVIEVSERDYAIWYRDMAEDLDKYVGKTVKVKGMTVRDEALKKNEFAFGRMVMTCCADDTTFHGIVTLAGSDIVCKNGEWYTVTALFKKEKHKMYKGVGPVFHLISMEKADAPEQPVATFD